jgi:hypothetical protein
MKPRVAKPIRLKAMASRSPSGIAAMQAELEGRRPAGGKPPRAIWTREFLASGKPGKQ